VRAIVLLAVALCLSGCGGVGSLLGFSIFEGHWEGTWDGSIDDGTVVLDIDASGDINGTIASDNPQVDGTVTGAVQNTGSVSLTITFDGEPPAAGDGNFALVNAGGTIQGVVTFDIDPVQFVMDGP
jgi:hypothetical protein